MDSGVYNLRLARWQKLIYEGEHQRHEKSRLVPDARDHDKTVLLLAEKNKGHGTG